MTKACSTADRLIFEIPSSSKDISSNTVSSSSGEIYKKKQKIILIRNIFTSIFFIAIFRNYQ